MFPCSLCLYGSVVVFVWFASGDWVSNSNERCHICSVKPKRKHLAVHIKKYGTLSVYGTVTLYENMFRHSDFGAWTQRDFIICDVFLKNEINKLSTSKSSKLDVKIEIFIFKFLLLNSVVGLRYGQSYLHLKSNQ